MGGECPGGLGWNERVGAVDGREGGAGGGIRVKDSLEGRSRLSGRA